MSRLKLISKAPVRAQSWPIEVKLQFAINLFQVLMPFLENKDPQNPENGG